MASQPIIQAPTGTRDLYPVEAARRRYITEAWRRVSINHGFEEIDGPTFETTELYTKKSGEGIVSEIFGVFSGKDEAGVKALGERLARGEDAPAPYALRPEFTPTLARMYAAKAASLPKPTKWFSVGPYFRAERPQRGRLREFLQLNADVIGLPGDPVSDADRGVARREADADVIACAAELIISLGLSTSQFKVRINDRVAIASILTESGLTADKHAAIFEFLDRVPKMDRAAASQRSRELKIPPPIEAWFLGSVESSDGSGAGMEPATRAIFRRWESELLPLRNAVIERLGPEAARGDFIQCDIKIVRGLAYYTGTVFEITATDERAIAGGGRYDNLIELFGGPPTPAVGFGMGDVVLSLVLQDKGLMPTDAELMGLVGQTPDVFVIAASPEAESMIPKVLADLRRATPRSAPPSSAAAPGAPLTAHRSPFTSAPGLHARRSYKTTKNVGKLLQEAAKVGARFAAIIESADSVKIKDMKSGAQDERSYSLDEFAIELRRRLGRA